METKNPMPIIKHSFNKILHENKKKAEHREICIKLMNFMA
jgi:hypothetical protein